MVVVAFVGWRKPFQEVIFLPCRLGFFLVGGRRTKCLPNYTLKRTKWHHLKRDSLECMLPEHLTNAETLSNIYSKRTILKEFSGEHMTPIPLTSTDLYSWASAEIMGTR